MTMQQEMELAPGEFVFEIHSISGEHAFGDLFYPTGKPLMADDGISTAQAACHHSRWTRRHKRRGDRLAVYIHRGGRGQGDFYWVTCARELSPELEAA